MRSRADRKWTRTAPCWRSRSRSIAPRRDGDGPGCQLPRSVSVSKTTPLVLVYHTPAEHRRVQ